MITVISFKEKYYLCSLEMGSKRALLSNCMKNKTSTYNEKGGMWYSLKYTYLLSFSYLSSGSTLSYENDDDIYSEKYGKG